MDIKKDLKIKLFSRNELVAESSDANLWGRVLTIITGGDAEALEEETDLDVGASKTLPSVRKLAKALGLPVKQVQGACSPSTEEPYLHLDKHYWEAFQKNHNVHGRGAIGPLQVAATLLVLWFECAGLGKPSAKQALCVLDTINLTDQNYARTLTRCSWLQYRNKEIRVNPAEISKAVAVAKAYCSKQSLEKAES